ncbi:MAG: dihydropteroate synthase [Anaerolineales bacterium]|nr:dihydropteroate synthase [Anaerolineales bacterium]
MKSETLKVRDFTFEWGSRTYIMGILNITPDSFSGDGILAQGDVVQRAVERAREFVLCGADILDVGGESTRPGSEPLDAQAEMKRVIPVVQALRKNFPQALISIDAYKAQVAEAALQAGADMVNDVWAFRADAQLAHIAARYQAPAILMHNRSNPASVEVRARLGGSYVGADYQNLVEDVKRELTESVEIALKAGVEEKRIVLDPGVGFGKTREHNLELINRLDEIRALGFPVLLGASRKSFIGFTLDLPPDQRVEGTAAATAIGIARGADIVRVHDVKEMARVAKMSDAITRNG